MQATTAEGVSLSAGTHQVLLDYNTADVDDSSVQELSWCPTVAMSKPNVVDSCVQLDSTGMHDMMTTLWRRGGYWAPHGESAPPLVEA